MKIHYHKGSVDPTISKPLCQWFTDHNYKCSYDCALSSFYYYIIEGCDRVYSHNDSDTQFIENVLFKYGTEIKLNSIPADKMVDGELYILNDLIFIYKNNCTNLKDSIDFYVVQTLNGNSIVDKDMIKDHIKDSHRRITSRKTLVYVTAPTLEQRVNFNKRLEDFGYTWDHACKKVISTKPVEYKFTLTSGSEVLVRNTNRDIWEYQIFACHYDWALKSFCCINQRYTQCIPFTAETEYLIGTNKKPNKLWVFDKVVPRF